MPLTLSPQVFAITASLIEERTGLHYDLSNLDILADRLSERVVECGLDSLLDYYYFLRYDPGGDRELQLLAETLVVHETYFFREIEPLRALVSTILPEMLRRRPRARVWSAACATGEEPYSLAMMLSEAGLLDRVEVVASDLSERALKKARAGLYTGRSLRAWSAAGVSQAQFEEIPQGIRVRDELRGAISWRSLNLMDADAIGAMGLFDVVLCRNVLIYFSEATIARITAHLGNALQPDGVLLVGLSESLLRFGTMFSCEEREGSFFYRKQTR